MTRPRTPEALLDTNTIILLPRLGQSGLLPPRGAVSTITIAELCVGPLVADDPEIAAVRRADLRAASNFPSLPFDMAAAAAYGEVVASLRRANRKAASRTTDALIAAVAMAHRLPLYTCDPGDFAGIDGLDVVAVPHPDRD